MTLYDLSPGDQILIHLRGKNPAVNVYRKSQKNLYKTTTHSSRAEKNSVTDLECFVISNAEKVLTVNFVSLTNRNKAGVAEIDYIAVKDCYLFSEETTQAFADQSDKGTGRVPLKVYRTKVTVTW